MTFSINDIKAQLVGGGYRPSLFSIQFANPVNPAGDLKVPFMARAAQLPGLQEGNIAVPYFGRKIYVPGNRTYTPWQCTIINDEDFLVRNALENWHNGINSFEGNLGPSNPATIKTDLVVNMYSKPGALIRQYTLHGAWPEVIADIPLDWNLTDQLSEFNVTFVYDYFEITGGSTGNAGGV